MKQIFDWLREQMQNHMDYCKTCHEEFSDAKMSFTYDVQMNAWKNALTMVDEAEAKWEAECCEWKWRNPASYAEAHSVWKLVDELRDFNVCPYCGKPIKISEVE